MKRLRVNDLGFDQGQILVRNVKGMEEHVAVLPHSLRTPLQAQLRYAKSLHEHDLAQGYGTVYLPPALAPKYHRDNKVWGWQYVFPSHKLSIDPRSGVTQCHHLSESVVQRAVKQAAKVAGKQMHQQDLAQGYGRVSLPFALSRKYADAGKEWMWQYVFPAAHLSVDPQTRMKRRHHDGPGVTRTRKRFGHDDLYG